VEERTFGGGGSAGPYRGHKGNLFEGGLRVPSVVSWPAGEVPQGEVRGGLVTGMDWYPTLAEWTGAQIPDEHIVDGKSISKVVSGSEESPHEEVYWRLGANPEKSKWVVRKGDWKLLGNTVEVVAPDDSEPLTAEDRELFLVNLKEDVGERRNVKEHYPERVEEMLRIRAEFESSLASEP
ncbi:MAG: sulfatase/phosphatase domain-containing protein, partial [Verrucomicrobiota bacterium]